MTGVTVMILLLLAWVMVKAVGSNARVLQTGRPARGILLSVANQPLGSLGTGLTKLQRRQVRIDIEEPGIPPYERDAIVLVPLNLVGDVLPGATVELRVTRTRIVIVGPGVGFNAAQLATQGRVDQGAA